ncbi:MAG TPA: ChaN family lipoprotein [Geobacteraceae bacterium]|nr:ChaN family lipoprotein [Geobacteraceae bacterium]
MSGVRQRGWRTCRGAAAVALLLLLSACMGGAARHLNIADRDETGRMLADLERAKVVFVGEFHDQRDHHRLQLDIIRHLHSRNIPLVIGFEMFKLDQQPLLDRWVLGEVPLEVFVARYLQGWSINWAEYDGIMLFARNNAIPMVALDAPADLVQAVTRKGAGALTPAAMRRLPAGTTTDISSSYRKFMSRAFRTHQIPDFMFDNFCAAQGLRNSTMARRISGYLADNPQRTMVVIAGVGHVMRRAVPSAVSGAGLSTRIVIPQVEGLYDELDSDDMDYFLTLTNE